MAGFNDRLESDILQLVLAAKAITNIADNTATTPSTAIWVALHTADPGDTATAGTNELSATGYTRIATARTTGATGWNCSTSAGNASPNSSITFPTLTSTSTGTITHASLVMTSATTAGVMIASGALSASINYGLNVIPQLTTASSFTLD
jgi:hypothetical protein